MKNSKILVTGCAGFIGYHLCSRLLENKNYDVYGIDNLNKYYDIELKYNRLKVLKKNKRFHFYKLDLVNKEKTLTNFNKNKYKYVIHLAAQAGVRHSISNPQSYVDSNIIGFFNILEGSKEIKVKHLIFASTSSVYGASKSFPLKEIYNTDGPLSFYAATKKSNEIMGYSYSHIFKLPITALRFFTVYGPFGRPDMALFKFADSIVKNKKIELFNKGKHYRDFTYIDDIIEGIVLLINKTSKDDVPFQVFNIGSENPHYLKKFLKIIEDNIGKKAKINFRPFQLGDVYKTHADISKLKKKTGYKPKTSLQKGIYNFIKWYRNYYSK